MNIKPIPTTYRGITFRSKLEAHWAVFFDLCKTDWEYEPQGFDLGDGVWYLPDFVIHNVPHIRGSDKNGDLWIEVKGKMTEKDALKIDYWNYGGKATRQKEYEESILKYGKYETEIGLHGPTCKWKRGILVLGQFPIEDENGFIDFYEEADKSGGPYYDMFYSFSTLDGDQWGAAPGVDKSGTFMLIEYEHGGKGESWHLTRDYYYQARNYRFDHRKK